MRLLLPIVFIPEYSEYSSIAANFGDAVVYEASHIDSAPSSFDVITVMSAEPFTLKSKTNGVFAV